MIPTYSTTVLYNKMVDFNDSSLLARDSYIKVLKKLLLSDERDYNNKSTETSYIHCNLVHVLFLAT